MTAVDSTDNEELEAMSEDVSTAEPPLEKPTETHFKVEVPTERMIRLRKVEPGMVLARDVNNRNDQLLFPKNTVLDDKAIRKLRNFNTRSLYIKDHKTKWVDEEGFKSLSSEAEWLDTKEVPVPEDEEADEQDAPEKNKFKKAFDFIGETDSPRRLEDFVASLEEKLAASEGDFADEVESLREQTGDVADMMQYIMAQLSKIDDSSTRQSVLENLYDMEKIPEQLLDDPDVPDDMVLDLEEIREDKQELKSRLQELIHEEPEVVDSLEQEEIPDATVTDSEKRQVAQDGAQNLDWDTEVLQQLLDLLALSDDEEKTETLLSILNDFVGEEGLELSELQDRLDTPGESIPDDAPVPEDLDSEELELLDDLLGESTAGKDTGVQDCMMEAFDAMEGGQWSEAINEFNNCLDRSLQGNPPSQFKDYEEEASDLLGQKQNLANRLDHALELPQGFESFSDVLNLTGDELFEALSDQTIASEDADAIQSFLEKRQALIFDFWEDLRDMLPQLLDTIGDSGRAEVLEEFQHITDDLIINHLKKPIEDNLYETDAPSGQTESKRSELLQDAIDEKDFSEIKRLNSLPETVIEKFEQHYRRPDELNKWQRKLLDLHGTILNQLIFGLRVPRKEVDRYLRQFREIYEAETKPYSLFLQPGDPEHYHLVHAYNSTVLSLMVGTELGLPEKAMESLMLSATLADVGLLVIPDSFYLIPDEMSRRAENEIRKHPIYSRKITSHIFGPQHTVTRTVAEHHERFNGEGYPKGKAEDELSPLTGVIGVADRYTAMVEARTYRSAKMPDDTLTILTEETEGLKKKPLETIEEIIGYYPNGSLVKLSDGTLAFVSTQVDDHPKEPVVFVLTDQDRNRLDSPIKKNLSEEDLWVRALLRT